jgi:hypothetical protein
MANARFLILSVGLAAVLTASKNTAEGQVHPQVPASVPSADSGAMSDMADHAMGSSMAGSMDMNMMKHMALTPSRAATPADSARARQIATDLKRAIAKYADTTAAVADGYKMFAPNVKNQEVFHFTNGAHGFKEAFRFNVEQPTSLLYKRDVDGKFRLIGAMYTMPKRTKPEKLDERIPLSIAHWHRHVNWCLPKLGQGSRLAERDSAGDAKFGPESPVATKAACDAVGGRFYASPLGWMVHVNVFEGDDLTTIYGDDHGARHHHGM